MECQNARSMIPSYCDGELSEAQAGPLRQHLLSCQPCRASAQDLKNLKRWFAEPEPVAVPKGFAARVARRAFQGDTGEVLVGASATASAPAEEGGRLFRFVLACTAAAAVVLLLLSLAVRELGLPRTALMDAAGPTPSLNHALEELDRLNRLDKAPHSAPHKP